MSATSHSDKGQSNRQEKVVSEAACNKPEHAASPRAEWEQRREQRRKDLEEYRLVADAEASFVKAGFQKLPYQAFRKDGLQCLTFVRFSQRPTKPGSQHVLHKQLHHIRESILQLQALSVELLVQLDVVAAQAETLEPKPVPQESIQRFLGDA